MILPIRYSLNYYYEYVFKNQIAIIYITLMLILILMSEVCMASQSVNAEDNLDLSTE